MDAQIRNAELAQAVREGLIADPPRLPSRFFYDARGSELFEQITRLDEYYLTRAERSILESKASEIARRAGASAEYALQLVELGSGSGEKTDLLIRALLDVQGELRYRPIDISATALEYCARHLSERHPLLQVDGVLGEYESGLACLRYEGEQAELILWLGSSIGNLDNDESHAFLTRVQHRMGPADRFLLGADLQKDPKVLEAAYDDSEGVTAAFNKNLLARINRELQANFDLDGFDHQARWRADRGRIECHLVATRDQTVRIETLDLEFEYRVGDAIHTENACKYTVSGLHSLVEGAGFDVEELWYDTEKRFVLLLLAPQSGAKQPAGQ